MLSWIVLAMVISPSPASVAPEVKRMASPAASTLSPLVWHTDYATAFHLAKKQRRRMLIFVRDDGPNTACRQFESETLADTDVRRRAADCVLLRLPLGTTATSGTSVRNVLDHASLVEMHGMPGVAIIDFSDSLAPHYGHVVSQLPFQKKKYFQRDSFHGTKSLKTLLDLPSGSLTQRTLIYAVRMHHESPRSAAGRMSKDLTEATGKHSAHQASIQLQGHHNWETRFAQINERLGNNLVPIEVCAESWPGENLVEAAVECVYSWRRSAGHWRAVSAYHPVYGFDMRRGANGIWYATGIFGKVHR